MIRIAAALAALALAEAAQAASMPPAATALRLDLRRAATRVWGPMAPIPFLAAQVHQESGWRADARSPYARGLTQFTPATEADITRSDPELARMGGALDPQWALRAQSVYVRRLYEQLGGKSDCHRMLFAAMAYNGGAKWVERDRAKAAASGDDPLDYAAVRWHNSGRRADFFRENHEYPTRIAYRWQPLYATWGRTVCIR